MLCPKETHTKLPCVKLTWISHDICHVNFTWNHCHMKFSWKETFHIKFKGSSHESFHVNFIFMLNSHENFYMNCTRLNFVLGIFILSIWRQNYPVLVIIASAGKQLLETLNFNSEYTYSIGCYNVPCIMIVHLSVPLIAVMYPTYHLM